MKALITITMLAASLFAAAPADQTIQRYLLVVGANNGGEERATLRYAAKDANTFAQVLTEMGGVPGNQVIRLQEPNVRSLVAGIAKLDANLRSYSKQGRKEVIVYYSGHADESGLQLGAETYSWKDLRKSVDALPAEVKITVLDACGSGAITRLKGGQRQPAFLVDASSDMKGYAFLTSSSDNEVAQESDRIGGSYFTQSLVTGMRGAADLNGDKKVTLSEAYQFAFNETLNRTQKTSGGAQHPSRDMKLSGTGDVVMTDLRDVSAGLILGANLEGRFYIRDEKQNLIAELQKSAGRPLELGLAPGQYSVQMVQQGFWIADRIQISEHNRYELTKSQFRFSAAEKAVARGSQKTRSQAMDSLQQIRSSQESEWDLGFFLASNDRPMIGHQAAILATYSSAPMIGNQLSFLANISRQEMDGIQASTGLNFASHLEGAQISSGINIAGYVQGLQLSAGFNLADTVTSLQVSPFNIGNHIGTQVGMLNIANRVKKHNVGMMNLAADVGGVQVGMFNATGKVGSTQVGMFNAAGSVNGTQVGMFNATGSVGKTQVGMFNATGSVGQAQVGMFNVTGSTGSAQVGMFNVNGHAKGPVIGIFNAVGIADRPVFGLVNLVGNGTFAWRLSTDELGMASSTLQTGTRWMHTNFIIAQDYTDRNVHAIGAGFGTRFGMTGRLWFSLDADWLHFFESSKGEYWGKHQAEDNHLSRYSFECGYKVLRNLGLFAGVSANHLAVDHDSPKIVSPIGDYYGHLGSSKDADMAWMGFYAGMQFGRF